MSASRGCLADPAIGDARSMATLIVTTSWPRTADPIAGTFVFDDACARARSGDDVIVATPIGPGSATIAHEIEAIDVPHAGMFGSPGAATRLRSRPWRARGLWPWRRAIAEIAERRRPERWVAHWLVPSALAVTTISSTAPLEAIAHGGDVRLLEALPRSIARACLVAIAGRAERLRAVSASLADRLVAIAPSLASAIVVGPMPLALDDAAARARVAVAADALRASFSSPFAVVVARLVRTKPVDAAIVAAATIAPVVVVVGDGPDRRRLEAIGAARGLDVRFVGAVAHEAALAWIGASTHVVVARAIGEGAPTVAREAGALGVATSFVDAQRGFGALADGIGSGAGASLGRLFTK